jgi:uncharacterized protein
MPQSISDEDLIGRFRRAGFTVERDTAAHFRGRLDRRLLMNRCESCGAWRHPPRPLCPSCWSDKVSAEEVKGTGTIYLAIFLHQGSPAEGVDYSTPYPVVTIELDEEPGLRFTSTVVDATQDEIKIGARVKLDWIERAGTPMPVFRLVEERA